MDKITFTALFTTSTEVPYVMNPAPLLEGVRKRRWNGLTALRKRTAESRHTVEVCTLCRPCVYQISFSNCLRFNLEPWSAIH